MTLGEQRLIAFRHAAGIWARLIDSPVRIDIDAYYGLDGRPPGIRCAVDPIDVGSKRCWMRTR